MGTVRRKGSQPGGPGLKTGTGLGHQATSTSEPHTLRRSGPPPARPPRRATAARCGAGTCWAPSPDRSTRALGLGSRWARRWGPHGRRQTCTCICISNKFLKHPRITPFCFSAGTSFYSLETTLPGMCGATCSLLSPPSAPECPSHRSPRHGLWLRATDTPTHSTGPCTAAHRPRPCDWAGPLCPQHTLPRGWADQTPDATRPHSRDKELTPGNYTPIKWGSILIKNGQLRCSLQFHKR